MKKFNQVFKYIGLIVFIILGMSTVVFAHSGRTDKNGGHKDNNNVSGLGSYHYHCGGYPAHLHTSGYCPYKDVFPSQVTINVSKTSLGIREKATISATVVPANACDTNVSWECSNTNVIHLSGGTIEAVGYGTAVITARTFNGKVSQVTITVKEIVANKVSIQNSVAFLYLDESVNLSAVISPSNVDNPSITWSSSDKNIATVDNNGKVQAIAPGTVVISATASNGIKGEISLIIKEKLVEKVELKEEKLELFINDEYNLEANIYPEDATNTTVDWKTSDDSILKISESGVLEAVGIGTAVVTATSSNGISDEISVVVSEIIAEKIEIQGKDLILIGEKTKMDVSFFPENTTSKDIQWSVSDENIATITQNGELTAKKVGTVTITAIQKDVSTSFVLQIAPIAVEKITIICDDEDGISEGDVIELKAEISPQNATYPQIFWKTSNPDIAIINENGVLETRGIGTVVITAYTQDGCSESLEIEVLMTLQDVLLTLGGMTAVGVGGVTGVVALIKGKRKRRKKN